MGYKLRENERLSEGLRRIVCEETEKAIAAASMSRNNEESPVHATRRHLKKARAALDFVESEIKGHLFKRERRRLRSVGRLVSDIRDAEVRLDTIRQLRKAPGEARNSKFNETEELLAFELQSFLAAFSDWQSEAGAKLGRARDGISEWRLGSLTRKQICRTLRETYASGRRSLRSAKKDSSAANFHVLRKKAKSLWYQLRILRELHPAIFREMSENLKTISGHLGHAHDLSFVGERLDTLAGASGRKRGRRALEALIDSRQIDLQRVSVALAERFYAEKPKEFAARMAEYFEDWERAKLRKSAQLFAVV